MMKGGRAKMLGGCKMKTKIAKSVKIIGRQKSSKKSAVEFIRKPFDVVKKFVAKLHKADLDKINSACRNSSQDIRLQRQSCSGVKLMNLHYAGVLKKYRGKKAVVLAMTKGILHTLNASDRKLLTVLGYLTGKNKVDVTKFYAVGNKISHRKALEIKIK